MKVRRRLVVAAAAVTAAAALGACGGEDDFPNEPRPAAPLDLTANITDREVILGTSKIGAGLLNITIANQSKDTATPTFDGPTIVTGPEMPPGTVGSLKASFEEGDYEVTAGEESGARAATLEVGPDRPSSQNEVLLP